MLAEKLKFLMQKISILFVIVFLLFACTKKSAYPEALFDGSKVIIDISLLREGIPVFYSFRYDSKSIDYFVIKIDNDIQSYFDACAECYPRKQGYRYEDGRVVCNACDVGYPIYTLKEGIGSCYPIKLKGRLRGNIYEIDIDKIIEGKRYF